MTRLSASFWALAAALAAIFAAALLVGGPGLPADRALLLALQQEALVPAARLLTRLGDWWLVLAVGAAAAALLFVRGARRQALVLAALLLSERLLVEQLKLLLDRVRPDSAGHLIAVHSRAFPSGHAANAMVLGLALALLLPASPRARSAAVAAALLFAFAVGTSRLILGVHWPSDVVGGWTLGALWTLLLVRLTAERLPGPGIDPLDKETIMTDRNDGNDRAETARRTDDSALVESMEDGPAFGGSKGGNLQREIGARDEMRQEVGDGDSVTRVRDSDKPEQADLPRFNQK